jgi:hypothetical protein
MNRHEFTLGNPKTAKGESLGYLTAILHLAPASSSGTWNVCPNASPGCIAACLNTSGHGGIFKKGETTNPVLEARKRRTLDLFQNRTAYIEKLKLEIAALNVKAYRSGLKLVVRPNGTSDLPFLAHALAKSFPDIQFYDYTKIPEPWKRTLPNYHLTFSRSETNQADTMRALHNGVNVAAVFDTPKGKALPATWEGFTVLDGDETDLRFLDARREKRGYVIGLHAKGRGKKDDSGFVVSTEGLAAVA